MKYKSLVIVPARGWASRIADTITALLSQSTTSDIVVAVDSDRECLEESGLTPVACKTAGLDTQAIGVKN